MKTLCLLLGALCLVAADCVPQAPSTSTPHGQGEGEGEGEGEPTQQSSCEAALDEAIARNQTDSCPAVETCHLQALRATCAGERADVVRGMVGCLAAEACSTPSAPGAAGDCLHELQSQRSVGGTLAVLITSCGGDRTLAPWPTLANGTGTRNELLPLTLAAQQSILDCHSANASCVDLQRCLATDPLIAAYEACVP